MSSNTIDPDAATIQAVFKEMEDAVQPQLLVEAEDIHKPIEKPLTTNVVEGIYEQEDKNFETFTPSEHVNLLSPLAVSQWMQPEKIFKVVKDEDPDLKNTIYTTPPKNSVDNRPVPVIPNSLEEEEAKKTKRENNTVYEIKKEASFLTLKIRFPINTTIPTSFSIDVSLDNN